MSYEFFEQFLFGDGFWLGFFIIMAIAFIVSSRVKHSSVIFIVGLIFLAMEYNDRLSGSSEKIWGLIMCLIAGILLLYMEVLQVKSKK